MQFTYPTKDLCPEYINNSENSTVKKYFSIKSGQKAKDAGLYDLVKQPDGMLKNCYVYGYACGVIQEDLNVVIPLQVMSFDDKAYSIRIDDTEYVLTQEWVDTLISN